MKVDDLIKLVNERLGAEFPNLFIHEEEDGNLVVSLNVYTGDNQEIVPFKD